MPPTIIDIGTDEDAGEWLRALPFVHFPVHPSGEDRRGGSSSPMIASPVNSFPHDSGNTQKGVKDHV